MTYRECYGYGIEALTAADIADAMIDARLLLEFVCHTTRHDLLLHGDRQVDHEKEMTYKACIARRSERIPLQHITGEQAFMGYDFMVNEHVLIPRQDTEVLVEEALHVIKPGMCILDMCTGSGCILLSLLAMSEGCTGIGADISGEALQVARKNKVQVERQCGKSLSAEFVQSDLFDRIKSGNLRGGTVASEPAAENDGCFDVIISNPPYIASAVIDTLEPEVRLHEPTHALDGTEDGLYFYRKIVTEGRAFLKKGGVLLFEIGHDQGEAVAELMNEAGFSGVTVRKDYAGLDRVVYGFYEEEA
ncbi:MAG: peptide chain release factor N(5)-glutamine methyltransferase [Lachnospiraceae bacterium]|nr:peptide chain release factor N(5)-glutamine methyltransferase [Lachnospiraceae bacterium]